MITELIVYLYMLPFTVCACAYYLFFSRSYKDHELDELEARTLYLGLFPVINIIWAAFSIFLLFGYYVYVPVSNIIKRRLK